MDATAHARLADVVAGWRARWAGRPLHGVGAGPGWVRLHVEGDEHPGLLLVDRADRRLALAVTGRLPAPLHAALAPDRRHPLRGLLDGAVLAGLGLLPADRVLACDLVLPDGAHRFLLHRLFGARGETVLLDADARVPWASRRPPHPLLQRPPDPATWTTGAPAADDHSAPALDVLLRAEGDAALRAARGGLDRRRRAARRLRDNLRRDRDAAGTGDEHRRRAEALAAHLHEVPAGSDTVTLADLRDGTPLVIALDPALTPAANLDALFRRAAKAERGREVVAARLAAAAEELRTLEDLAAALDAAAAPDDPATRLAGLQAWRAAHGPRTAPARSRHAADEPGRPFRRYLVDGRWEVWVGRSAAENDELTHRASHGRDLWLHAQGVAGSHVVVRTGGRPDRVPRAVVHKAARLAALHSKARHSGLVPVVWTERRYVRRPRKAAPGTAVCLQEQSLMVEPGVAPGVESV